MPPLHTRTTVCHHHLRRCSYRRHHIRTFVNARIKWVRDRHLDAAVEREKNLKPLLSLKHLILSHPTQTLPIATISPLKPDLRLPTSAAKFIQKYPMIFKTFLPPQTRHPLPHVKLTPRALALNREETSTLAISHYRKDAAQRLAKLLMLARAGKLPLHLIEMFKYDLGLPHDYLKTLTLEFPDYFQICDMGFSESRGDVVFGLELVSWPNDLAVSEMQRRQAEDGKIGMQIRYSMNLPKGFDLEKRVLEWVDEWQNLPYISPYEDASHLLPSGDLAEKWTVGFIHEVLNLFVSKKTERDNLFCLADFLGFGRMRLKKALVHFPGIFYVSNKLSTQTVVLREAYIKNLLIEKHPLMVMRNKHVSLMNLVLRRGKPIEAVFRGARKGSAGFVERGKKKVDYNRWVRSDDDED
ncbi:ubiquitin carboxyl-terminal hydrolase family protein [Striga asiatica]|uniref:Ubiquitin carboxyl-terminal hydrolase family protein n=1 Tax=Striga asiatica TaxID=4170 RepID=A0A5A7Q5Y7_STRAF|nr:ubiquitin carboxyl-terminal hydrolase family protein [Striga asiatica]